jgi:uncharacterized membrane protein YoaK (UPF0700 family)
MFRHQGPTRSDRQNRVLAGYLAFVGGYVNSAGFVLIGTFTSHVTGNVGRFSNDLAVGQLGAALTAFTMVAAFVIGAFVASLIVETTFFGRTSTAYAVALGSEATLLAAFWLASTLTPSAHPRLRDMEAAILCCAMGMQNSLVTRLSGAVIRTTHLTGVLTDIGIEAARWFRWWHRTMSNALRVKLGRGRNPAEKPAQVKVSLLLTIAGAFTVGAMAGSVGSVLVGRVAILFPAVAVLACGGFAYLSGRDQDQAPISGVPDTRR